MPGCSHILLQVRCESMGTYQANVGEGASNVWYSEDDHVSLAYFAVFLIY